MSIRPLGNRVVIKQQAALEKVGNILIPETLQHKGLEGVVKAVGPGLRAKDGSIIPMEVKIGDFVMFSRGPNVTEIKVDGQKFVIVPETDILGVDDGINE